jgi:hypothetical protein
MPTFKILDPIGLARMLASKLAIPFNAKPFASSPGDGTNVADRAEIAAVREPFTNVEVGHRGGICRVWDQYFAKAAELNIERRCGHVMTRMPELAPFEICHR